jgi:hypothetical protein
MLSTTRYLALVGGGQKPKFPQNHVRSVRLDTGVPLVC